MNKIDYTGSSKIIQKICAAINDLIDGGGGGGSTVSITPTITSGIKIADYTVDNVSGSLYAPIAITQDGTTPPSDTRMLWVYPVDDVSE